jgi:hypothetical protein
LAKKKPQISVEQWKKEIARYPKKKEYINWTTDMNEFLIYGIKHGWSQRTVGNVLGVSRHNTQAQIIRLREMGKL